MRRLSRKVAIITGAAGGIGSAMAVSFAREGATLLLVDRDEAALNGLVARIGPERCSTCVADISDPEDVERATATAVDRYGRLDILMSNAGIEGRVLPLAEYPLDAFDRVMAVNVRGVFLSLRAAMPAMQESGGGSIVITSSIAGLRGFAGLSAYAASKHAVLGLMRCAALEGAAYGIRVNTIHPSPIETRMMRAIEEGAAPGAAEAAKAEFAARIPAGRYGTPEEVAALALFLAGDESGFCSGGAYSVDGAMSAG
ncbi:oxidoreductase [Methylobacterium indicum]|uniref:SDR family NAD(P)-dependent oxidoreductase n=1 Tax=Methylobacterium indicum TaxID=1775910 RepID=UPI00073468DE|nr:SDR family oxidoreductase [Methylobacterium indicum]KTS38644.1 oxidoreductase [Methylobacterium indicum]KTS42693.1 oxidoreductase [Methylobacterium indicum]KTS52361.1 oxidoreductase [Methylobacterium indicum]